MPVRLTLDEHRERAVAWRTFVEVNGRQPGNRPDAPASESSLYYWIFKRRQADAEGKLPAELRAVLDDAAPDWREPRDPSRPNPELHAGHAHDYLTFVMKHGRAPSQLARSRRELSLHQWMNNQRSTLSAGKMHPDVRRAIDAVIPGWDAASGLPPRQRGGEITPFAVRMWELEGYLATSGGLLPPSNSNGPHDGLGRWLQVQRRQLARGELKRNRKRALDRVAPGWDSERRSDQKWSRRVDELAAFVAARGRFPRHTRKDDAERALQNWLVKVRKDDDLSDDQVAALDAAVPDWRGGRGVADSWAERTREIQAWIADHGHRPRPQSADAVESRLGFWLTRQRRAQREGRLSVEAAALLTAALPGWESADVRQAEPRQPRERRPRVPVPKPPPPVKRERTRKPTEPRPAPVTTDTLIDQAQRDVTNRQPTLAWDDPFEYAQRVTRRYLRLADRARRG